MSASRHGLPLEEQLDLDRLLDEAFARGRARTAPIGAARVRARVAWDRPRPASPGWRGIALLGRLSEGSLALGMTAILFVGALGGVTGQTETVQPERGGEFVVRVSTPLDESRFLRLLRIGRTAPVADNVDPATALPVVGDDDGEQLSAVAQRQGLLR
ncbi:MAG TPA: hypothetical protein VFW12_07850 [Candidatus Limnocylindria bacterium]|nr:hypothetical protein [Candidatus Limnocylindria bacterium]